MFSVVKLFYICKVLTYLGAAKCLIFLDNFVVYPLKRVVNLKKVCHSYIIIYYKNILVKFGHFLLTCFLFSDSTKNYPKKMSKLVFIKKSSGFPSGTSSNTSPSFHSGFVIQFLRQPNLTLIL